MEIAGGTRVKSMSALRLTAIVAAALATSACVNMGQLNREVLAESGEVSASVPTVDCGGDTAPSGPKSLVTVGRTKATTRPAFVAVDMSGMSDLDAGKALILGSGGVRAGLDREALAAVPTAAAMNASFGWQLEQFAEDMPRVSEASMAEAKLAVEGDHANGAGVQRLIDVFMTGSAATDRSAATAHFDRENWTAMLQHLSTATAEDGWTSDFAARAGRFAKSGGLRAMMAGTADVNEVRDLQRSYLIAAYMKAYFRNGQIFQLNFSDADLKQALEAAVAKKVTDTNTQAAVDGIIDGAASQILTALCPNATNEGCKVLGLIGEQTFVTRAGKSYGFPGVTATIDPGADKKVSTNKIDTDELVTDLLRVALEAAGDANFAVPGVPNSTACSQTGRLCVSKTPGDSDYLTDAQVASISDTGDKSEATTTTTVGIIVRGGWLFSLNNETLAKSIETALGVSARKVSEYVAWKNITGACTVPSQMPYRRVALSFDSSR